MATVTLLRKLTRKSTLKFGRYYDLTVQNVLDTCGITGLNKLTWYYYNAGSITFFDDILDELGITKDIRIDKPGKINPNDMAKYNYLTRKNRIEREQNLSEEEQLKLRGIRRKTTHSTKKHIRAVSKIENVKFNSKKLNQLRNQGHG